MYADFQRELSDLAQAMQAHRERNCGRALATHEAVTRVLFALGFDPKHPPKDILQPTQLQVRDAWKKVEQANSELIPFTTGSISTMRRICMLVLVLKGNQPSGADVLKAIASE